VSHFSRNLVKRMFSKAFTSLFPMKSKSTPLSRMIIAGILLKPLMDGCMVAFSYFWEGEKGRDVDSERECPGLNEPCNL
jgi:hypothetical protein